jgi:hypothetical protein
LGGWPCMAVISRSSSPLIGVARPQRSPSATISPLSWATSLTPGELRQRLGLAAH